MNRAFSCLSHHLGFPMATNLRARMPEKDLLVVHDINQDLVERFVDESGNRTVEVGRDVRELAERCVRLLTPIHKVCQLQEHPDVEDLGDCHYCFAGATTCSERI